MARLQESRETRTSGCSKPGGAGQGVESAAAEALVQGVHQRKDTELETGRQQEGGAGPGGLPASRAAAVMASLEESRETETSGAQQKGEREGRDTVAAEVLVQDVQESVIDKRMEPPHEKTSDTLKAVLESRKKASTEEDKSSSDENVEEGDKSDLVLTPRLERTSQAENKNRRNRGEKWLPPDGMRRCGQKCSGCAAKCVTLGQDECTSCHTNRIKETTSNACLNRGPCNNMKEQKPKDDRSRKRTKTPGQRDTSSQSLPRQKQDTEMKTALTTKVGQQAVVSRIDLVKEVVENIEGLEKEGGKRNREESGHTPEKEKRASKIAVLRTGSRGSAGCTQTQLL